jgi:lipopolysaccharide biosynthesis glycosyltransferase
MTSPAEAPSGPADIVYACDENYVIPLAVSLRSLQDNTDARALRVCVLCDGLSAESKRRVLDSVPVPQTVRLVDIPAAVLPDQVGRGVSTRISRAAFAVLKLAPELVNPRRWLYLDADTVVRTDIRALLDTDLGGMVLGAVYDHAYTLFERRTDRLAKAGASPGRRFNSGVMLVDTQAWFRDQVGPRAESTARAWRLMDQGALNVVCARRWLELDPGWNVTTQALLLDKEFRAAPHKVFIRHLTAIKPWLTPHSAEESRRLMLDDFHRYQERTHWANVPVSPVSTRDVSW